MEKKEARQSDCSVLEQSDSDYRKYNGGSTMMVC